VVQLVGSVDDMADDDRTPSLVFDLDDVGRGDVALVGGKAANLGELRRGGFRVPDGFVVTTEAHRRSLADPGGMSGEVERSIRSAYDALAVEAVAVRSSAVDEDGAVTSHAGLHDSFLDCTDADEVVDRVRDCWVSSGSERAVAYRSAFGQVGDPATETTAPMAVVVQVMAPTERTGVMFTTDPLGERPGTVVIEATLGGAGLVVGGEVAPDAFTVDVGAGSDAIVRVGVGVDSGAGPGAGERDRVLSDGELTALVDLGRAIEAYFGRPQDIEWTIGSDGGIWVVQARPVTTGSVQGGSVQGGSAPGTTAPGAPTGEVLLRGLGASPGIGTGAVKVVRSVDDALDLLDGEVLVAAATSPAWVPAMARAAAIVTDLGGITSHAAIVARELGVPAVVGALSATTDLYDGQVVTVDGGAGEVHRPA